MSDGSATHFILSAHAMRVCGGIKRVGGGLCPAVARRAEELSESQNGPGAQCCPAHNAEFELVRFSRQKWAVAYDCQVGRATLLA